MLQASDERSPGWLDRWKRPGAVLFLALATVGAARWLGAPTAGQPIALPTLAASARAPRPLTVHVTGAVAQPGVYTFADGLRVADAIDQAGGPAEGADVAGLNLAARLQDGQRLVVPRLVDPTAASARPSAAPARPSAAPARPSGSNSPSAAPTRLDLNRATVAELEALPAIGRVTAERIVRYRDQHGPFGSADDLRRAGLLSTAALARILDLVDAP